MYLYEKINHSLLFLLHHVRPAVKIGPACHCRLQVYLKIIPQCSPYRLCLFAKPVWSHMYSNNHIVPVPVSRWVHTECYRHMCRWGSCLYYLLKTHASMRFYSLWVIEDTCVGEVLFFMSYWRHVILSARFFSLCLIEYNCVGEVLFFMRYLIVDYLVHSSIEGLLNIILHKN